jgi:hypothetical protein
MEQFSSAKEDFILLAEAGFIAINQADEDAALKLFRAAELLNPKNTLPRIGMGYLHFLKLELKQAGKIFEDVLAAEPTNEMANALLGLSLALSPTETIKGEKILEEIVKTSQDPSVKTMALTAVEFVEKFVKKPGAAVPQAAPKEKKKK